VARALSAGSAHAGITPALPAGDFCAADGTVRRRRPLGQPQRRRHLGSRRAGTGRQSRQTIANVANTTG
jgi:hypothetical protein